MSFYSILVWTTNFAERIIIGFSSISDFQVYLPVGSENTFDLNLIMSIRDGYECLTEYNMSSVVVRPDPNRISMLIANLQGSTRDLNKNINTRLLVGGNQNIIGQIITSICQETNQLNIDNLDNALLSNNRVSEKRSSSGFHWLFRRYSTLEYICFIIKNSK